MKKLDLWCTGQIADARSYLMKQEGYSPEKVALMTDNTVSGAITEIVDKNNFHVIHDDNGQDIGQDIGLVPDEVWSQITWFRR